MADRISNLPDEILCHILSFLSTEEAVATSVLSKRWSPLWLLVSTLDFNEERYILPGGNRSCSSFIHFVSTTILARGFHQPIKCLRFTSKYLIPDLKIWLNAAIQRQVESIEISFSSVLDVEHNIFSCSRTVNIFSCRTLVVLKLSVVSFIPFPSVDLPSLKTLHLGALVFPKPEHFMELVNGCPILENFEAKYLCFNFSSFKFAFSFCNFKPLPKLVWAHVASFRCQHIPIIAFCNVEFLRPDKYCDLRVNGLMFPNLIHMELILERKVEWNSVLDLLNVCPKLQTFVLENEYGCGKIWPNSHVVPEGFSSQLRKCFLKNFEATECEMRFAKYIMQNSTSLRTMTICSKPDSKQQKKLEMITELASCPTSSATCELLFK